MKSLAVLLFLFSLNVCANSNNGYHRIISINIHDSGHVLLKLEGSDNTESCSAEKYANYVVLDKDYPHFDRMYSMALTAYSSNQEIKSWVNGCIDLWGGENNKMVKATTMVIGQ